MVDFRYKHLKILALTSLFSVNASVKFDNSVDLPHKARCEALFIKVFKQLEILEEEVL